MATLHELLASAFTVDELRRFLAAGVPEWKQLGRDLLADLPEGPVSRNQFAFAAVEAMEARGLVTDGERVYPGPALFLEYLGLGGDDE